MNTKKSKFRFLKSTSLLVTCLFTLNTVGMSAGVMNPAATQNLSTAGIAMQDLWSVQIPHELGEVISKHQGSEPGMIFYVQDAHVNKEAQLDIARIIHYINTRFDVNLVGLEGAEGEIKHQYFSAFPIDKVRKTISDYLVDEAIITGPEYFAFVKNPHIKLYGTEDKNIYDKNRQAFLNAIENQERDFKILEKLRKTLENLSHLTFPAVLKELMSERTNFQKNYDIVTYLNFLSGVMKSEGVKFESKQIQTFFQILDIERGLSQASLTEEVENVLASKSASTELKIFASKVKGFFENKEAFLFEDTVKAEDFKGYDQIQAYYELSRLNSQVDASLFDDITALEDKLITGLIQSEENAELYELFRVLETFEKIFDFSLTETDASFFFSNRNAFESKHLESRLKNFFEKNHYELNVADLDLDVLDGDVKQVEDFYRIALERDHVLIDNLVKRMDETGEEVSVIVTGGFHTPGIERYLQDKDYSYMVIRPRISEQIDERKEKKVYVERMVEETTAVENFFSAPLNSRLSGVSGDPRYQLSAELKTSRESFLLAAASFAAAFGALSAGTVLPTDRVVASMQETFELSDEDVAVLTQALAPLEEESGVVQVLNTRTNQTFPVGLFSNFGNNSAVAFPTKGGIAPQIQAAAKSLNADVTEIGGVSVAVMPQPAFQFFMTSLIAGVSGARRAELRAKEGEKPGKDKALDDLLGEKKVDANPVAPAAEAKPATPSGKDMTGTLGGLDAALMAAMGKYSGGQRAKVQQTTVNRIRPSKKLIDDGGVLQQYIGLLKNVGASAGTLQPLNRILEDLKKELKRLEEDKAKVVKLEQVTDQEAVLKELKAARADVEVAGQTIREGISKFIASFQSQAVQIELRKKDEPQKGEAKAILSELDAREELSDVIATAREKSRVVLDVQHTVNKSQVELDNQRLDRFNRIVEDLASELTVFLENYDDTMLLKSNAAESTENLVQVVQNQLAISNVLLGLSSDQLEGVEDQFFNEEKGKDEKLAGLLAESRTRLEEVRKSYDAALVDVLKQHRDFLAEEERSVKEAQAKAVAASQVDADEQIKLFSEEVLAAFPGNFQATFDAVKAELAAATAVQEKIDALQVSQDTANVASIEDRVRELREAIAAKVQRLEESLQSFVELSNEVFYSAPLALLEGRILALENKLNKAEGQVDSEVAELASSQPDTWVESFVQKHVTFSSDFAALQAHALIQQRFEEQHEQLENLKKEIQQSQTAIDGIRSNKQKEDLEFLKAEAEKLYQAKGAYTADDAKIGLAVSEAEKIIKKNQAELAEEGLDKVQVLQRKQGLINAELAKLALQREAVQGTLQREQNEAALELVSGKIAALESIEPADFDFVTEDIQDLYGESGAERQAVLSQAGDSVESLAAALSEESSEFQTNLDGVETAIEGLAALDRADRSLEAFGIAVEEARNHQKDIQGQILAAQDAVFDDGRVDGTNSIDTMLGMFFETEGYVPGDSNRLQWILSMGNQMLGENPNLEAIVAKSGEDPLQQILANILLRLQIEKEKAEKAPYESESRQIVIDGETVSLVGSRKEVTERLGEALSRLVREAVSNNRLDEKANNLDQFADAVREEREDLNELKEQLDPRSDESIAQFNEDTAVERDFYTEEVSAVQPVTPVQLAEPKQEVPAQPAETKPPAATSPFAIPAAVEEKSEVPPGDVPFDVFGTEEDETPSPFAPGDPADLPQATEVPEDGDGTTIIKVDLTPEGEIKAGETSDKKKGEGDKSKSEVIADLFDEEDRKEKRVSPQGVLKPADMILLAALVAKTRFVNDVRVNRNTDISSSLARLAAVRTAQYPNGLDAVSGAKLFARQYQAAVQPVVVANQPGSVVMNYYDKALVNSLLQNENNAIILNLSTEAAAEASADFGNVDKVLIFANADVNDLVRQIAKQQSVENSDVLNITAGEVAFNQLGEDTIRQMYANYVVPGGVVFLNDPKQNESALDLGLKLTVAATLAIAAIAAEAIATSA